MKTLRIAAVILSLILPGCRSIPTDLVIRLESPLPLRVVGQRLSLNVEYSKFDGRPLITTTILPEAVLYGRP